MKLFTILPLTLSALVAAAPSQLTPDNLNEGFNEASPISLLTRDTTDADRTTCDEARRSLATCQTENSELEIELDNLQNRADTCAANLSTAQNDLGQCQADLTVAKYAQDYLQCPKLEGTQTTVDGITYDQYCFRGIKAGTGVLRSEAISYAECLKECSADSKCNGVNYWPANKKPCLMISGYNPDVNSAPGKSTLISAVPTQKRT